MVVELELVEYILHSTTFLKQAEQFHSFKNLLLGFQKKLFFTLVNTCSVFNINMMSHFLI